MVPTAKAIEVDHKLACGILLSVDDTSEAFLRLAFPSVYGAPTQKVRERSQKLIDAHHKHFNIPASPRVAAQRAEVLAHTPIISTRNFHPQDDLLRGGIFERVVVVTHPSYFLFEEKVAAGLATDPRFKDVPRIILASEDFPLATGALLSQATLLQYSAAGNMTPAPVVKSAYLMGGYAFYCLSHTARELIREAFASNQKSIELIFLSKFVYHNEYENDEFGEVNRAFIKPWASNPDWVAELLSQYLFADFEHDEIPLPEVYPARGSAKMSSAKVWEGRFHFAAHPEFTIHVVVDGN